MTRTADLATAALLLLIGLIAVVDSLRLGAGWGSDGPKSGFFPFWLGTLLLVVTVVIAVQAWRRGPGKPFVTREQLRPVMQVLWPAVAMVALTAVIGLYVASALILLTSLYWGALFGGAITSILFNIPGEPWSVATTFDGYPLARQGQGGQALTAAFTSSFVGALFSIVLITLFAPLLAEIALRFGPPEFFAIQLLTFSSFVGLGGGNPLKSLVSILLGFILAAVGLDIVTGQLRMTFGITDLMKGFDFIIAVIGLFGIGEILLSVEEGLTFRGAATGMNLKVVLQTWKILPRYARTFVRGAFIGFWMGFKPGGATPASFMSYAFAKRFSKHPERFGKGEIEGVIAPETAAHAAGVAAILPMITLGIPGSPTAAVMLGGLITWGLQLAPLVLALVLGDLAENALRQSLIMSQGSLAIFLNRPIAGVITAAAIFFFVLPVLTPWWRRVRGASVPASRRT